METSLTGITDTDRLILLELDDRSLSAVFCVSWYVNSLCNDDLWRLKLHRLFHGHITTTKPRALYQGLAKYKTVEDRLIWASENGHCDVVCHLLNNGADIHASNDCALRTATAYGKYDILSLLLSKGADGKSVV